MKVDEALTKIEAAVFPTAELTDEEVTEKRRVVLRPILSELYMSGMDQGRLQLQEDLRHLLGVVKE